MRWHEKLWGIEFRSSPDGEKMLLGRIWHSTKIISYDGEPTRALVFCTRKAARAWCRNKMNAYKGQEGVCRKWRFRPIRVIETVTPYANG